HTTEQNGETNNDEDNESSTGQAHRYSKTPRDAEPKPITMKYYPPGWQATLETVKNNMRRHVALVFNEHSTFRQKLKRVAQRIISLKYTNLLCSPEFKGGNQQEEYDLVIHANIAHPAISTTIHQFFYADNDCLANLFPEDFEQTVPDHNCLEEYVDFSYKKQIPLDGDKYRAIMKQHLTLIDTLKGHQYHGAQYESCCTRWARKGM
ncbi:hypothetical protein BYT27DRAFT_7325725, partial [Phlegmacium glaucopus]